MVEGILAVKELQMEGCRRLAVDCRFGCVARSHCDFFFFLDGL